MWCIEVIVDGIDVNAARDLIVPHAFTTRFREALLDPPHALGLSTQLQRATWEGIVSQAGRPVTTTQLAKAGGLSREHLRRHFARHGAANTERCIGLARLRSA